MTKKPLVLGSQGQIQQLQTGDSVAAVSQFDATNGDAFSHLPGTVVYISSADTVQAATANSINTVKAVAVSNGTNAASATGSYQIDGVVGGYSGLTPGSTYFLSPISAGAVTSTPPSAAGQWVMVGGTAYSATEIDIAFGVPIQL